MCTPWYPIALYVCDWHGKEQCVLKLGLVNTPAVQLTSLQSLQTSLDTLRQYRPAYTPRTGFVWPIKEATTSTETTKKRGLDTEAGSEEPTQTSLTDTPVKPAPAQESVKKRQNTMLLLNAMRTTAVHANKAFTLPTAVSETRVAETPVSATGRSSATPAPSQRGGTPKPSASADNASAKGSTGGGKKKRKRELNTVCVGYSGQY